MPVDEPSLEWTPEPLFPIEPEFYRRVLRHLPTPIVVVGVDGEIRYVNQAMLALGGWDLSVHANILDIATHIHPDDRDRLMTSFAEISSRPSARILGTGRPWAEIYFRVVLGDGSTLPIELVGSGGVLDPAVNGIIYEVRPARKRDLLGRVLDGLSSGASMHYLLTLVLEIITNPPLDLAAFVLRTTQDGSTMIAASSDDNLSDVIASGSGRSIVYPLSAEPQRINFEDLPGDIAEQLRALGYQDFWCVPVTSALTSATMRIVACAKSFHVPAGGPINRLIQARELASAVLLRSQADDVLDYAGGHDRLTELPNRTAFHELAEGLDFTLPRAAVHLDIDGMKRVNAAYGHATGDAVLQIVADRMRSIHAADAVLGRVGDDEFSVVFSNDNRLKALEDAAMDLAERAQVAVSEPIVVAGRSVYVSASIGIAVAGAEVSLDHLLTWADVAMRESKRAGGNRINRHQLRGSHTDDD